MNNKTKAIELLEDYFKQKGRVLNMGEYRSARDAPIRYQIVQQIFGSWNKVERIMLTRRDKTERTNDLDDVIADAAEAERNEFEAVKGHVPERAEYDRQRSETWIVSAKTSNPVEEAEAKAKLANLLDEGFGDGDTYEVPEADKTVGIEQNKTVREIAQIDEVHVEAQPEVFEEAKDVKPTDEVNVRGEDKPVKLNTIPTNTTSTAKPQK